MKRVLLSTFIALFALTGSSIHAKKSALDEFRCKTCRTVLEAANEQVTSDAVIASLKVLLKSFKLEDGELNALTVAESLQQLILTPDYFCGKIVKMCDDGPQYVEITDEEAIREILNRKGMKKNTPLDVIDKLYYDIENIPTFAPRKTLRFAHIADAHLDLWYEEGAIADCQSQYCCRKDTYHGVGSIKGGKFGSSVGPCDPPRITFEETLNFIRDILKPDVIVWTGDNSPHDAYQTSQNEVTITLNETTKMIQAAFPDKMKSTFATYGNHDAYPNNQWNFQTGNKAVQDSMSLWKAWMDDDQYEQFMKTGYYSQKLDLVKGRLVKVISINTLSCDTLNKYTFSTLSDPNNQLDFLLKELDLIEKENGYAVLLSHIIPEECTHPWAIRFRAVLDRYRNTVRMNLFGHTHSDQFKVVRAHDKDLTPIGVMTICGGITTWGGNPSVCVYDVDEETMLPVARYTYAFDMDTANKNGFIEWNLYTDWLKDYKMKDLSPASYFDLA